MFPVEELTGIPRDVIDKYYKHSVREKVAKQFAE